MLAQVSRQWRRSVPCFAINMNNGLLFDQRNEYMTAPLVAIGGVTASAFGAYWMMKAHFNPIKSRAFEEVMKTQMIGQFIEEVDIKQKPLNVALQKQMTDLRLETIKNMRLRFEFQFLTGTLCLRPIVMDDSDGEYKDIDTKKLMFDYGICHAFWILNAGAVDYILDFVREGIRFEMVQNAHQTIEDHSDIYIPCFPAPVHLNINSYALLDWIEEQQSAQYKLPYDLSNNHCLHFADEFGQHFKPERFTSKNTTFSKFNTGIQHKSNQELLEWTKSIIDSKK